MPVTNWRHFISYSDIRARYEADAISDTEFAVALADLIDASPWAKENPEVERTTHELRYAQTITEIDSEIERLYDLADSDLVWLDATGE